jgi:hypothetical protein
MIRKLVPGLRRGPEQVLAAAEADLEKGRAPKAFNAIRALAETGHAEAQYRLALLYENGRGTLQSHQDALKWLRAAAEQGHVEAQNQLGIVYLAGRVSTLAATPAALAQFEREGTKSGSVLRAMFPEGVSVKPDPVEAVRWNRAAAEAGHAAAQARLGYQYASGLGVDRDRVAALRWLEASAAQDDETGLLSLGALHAGGHGDPPDFARAAALFARLAERGNTAGLFNLGILHLLGEGVERDATRAEALLRGAAEKDDAQAMGQLGILLAAKGTEEDLRAAETWLRRAAGRGYVPAIVALGRLFAQGIGGSHAEAGTLLRDASEQGSGEASHLVGLLHHLGLGVPVDLAEAARWYLLALDQGYLPSVADLLAVRSAGAAADVDLGPVIAALERRIERGDPAAAYFLGLVLLEKGGARRDPERAALLLQQAADAGSAAAAARLGIFHAAGEGDGTPDYAAAARWYEIAAAAGDRPSRYNLAFLHLQGIGVPRNPERAVALLSRLADDGFAPAAEALCAQYGAGKHLPADAAAAERWLDRAIALGSTEAARLGARMSLEQPGGNAEPNPAEAKRLLEIAAEAGDSAAQVELGRFLQFGLDGNPSDMVAAQGWMERAAASGHPEALAWLGDVHRQRLSERARPEVAEQYYRLASERGHVGAMLMLAGLKFGPGKSDAELAEAVALWRQAAELGDLDAKRHYGGCLLQGIAVPQDISKGLALVTEAAEGGNVPAQVALGVFHTIGGWPQSDVAAAPGWFRRAAEGGNADGQYNLGVCYKRGLGVPADAAAARHWYRLAADQGLSSAQLALADLLLQQPSGPSDLAEAASLYHKVADIYPQALYSLARMYAYGRGVATDMDVALGYLRRAAEQGHEAAIAAWNDAAARATNA